MSTNFISAADLPITEASSVDVLCVENGELKRLPAADISGSGGGYVIELTAETMPESGIEPNEDGNIILEINDISYDAFIEILVNGGSVSVDFSALMAASGMEGFIVRSVAHSWMFVPTGMLGSDNYVVINTVLSMSVGPGGGGMMPMTLIFSGTWTPPAEEA